jgi:hypothetical protein
MDRVGCDDLDRRNGGGVGREAFTGLDGWALHGRALRELVDRHDMAWVGGAYRAVFVPSSIRTVFVLDHCVLATSSAHSRYTDFFGPSLDSLVFRPRYALSPSFPCPCPCYAGRQPRVAFGQPNGSYT